MKGTAAADATAVSFTVRLGLAPAIGATASRVAHPLNVGSHAGTHFPRALNRFTVSGFYSTRTFGVRPSDRVITLRSPFHIQASIGCHGINFRGMAEKFRAHAKPRTVGPQEIVGCRFRRGAQVLCAGRYVWPRLGPVTRTCAWPVKVTLGTSASLLAAAIPSICPTQLAANFACSGTLEPKLL